MPMQVLIHPGHIDPQSSREEPTGHMKASEIRNVFFGLIDPFCRSIIEAVTAGVHLNVPLCTFVDKNEVEFMQMIHTGS